MRWLRRIVRKGIEWSVHRFIVPAAVQRDKAEQEHVDQLTANLVLYKFDSCPYCVRVFYAIDRLGLRIAMRDTRQDPAARQELLSGGGKTQVPCLRILHEDGRLEWMYESLDIIDYLKDRFTRGAA